MAMKRFVKAQNVTRGAVLGVNVRVASKFQDRLIGLLGADRLEDGDGLFITPCTSIHSVGMRFVFDAIFIGPDGKILYLREKFPKNTFSGIVGNAWGVLELPHGTIERTDSLLGDEVRFEPPLDLKSGK
jgi:uncharacterized membrane protein (UPF0127 family)